MSCSYADGLSPYHDKGKLGLAEHFDKAEDIQKKVKILAEWINQSKHVVVHTGAGISTSAGIPDFRGPKGVWTLEQKGEKPTINVSFNEAIPTKTHMAIVKLVRAGKLHFVISQNIDGLHLRSGLPRKYLAELHGNMFIEQCHRCQRQFVRNSATTSVGQKCLEKSCPTTKSNGRSCRGKLHDTILDWEHDLPEKDLGLADFHSCLADLSICLGTTLQIVPSGTLPLNTKKYNSGKMVICNLQPTKYDKKADLLIHTYVDDIMVLLMKEFNLDLPEFDSQADPSRQQQLIEWTIPDSEVRQMRALYERTCCKAKKKRKTDEDECKSQLELKPEISLSKPASKMLKIVDNSSILHDVKLEPKITETMEDNSTSLQNVALESKMSKVTEDNFTILQDVKVESQSSQDLGSIAIRKQDEREDLKNWLDEVPSDSPPKTNEVAFCSEHDESKSSNHLQIFQKQNLSEDLSQITENTYDSDLNKPPSVMNNEIISC